MVTVTIYMPGVEPARAELRNGAYLIGASSPAHIVLDHPSVSRRHAQLIVSDSTWRGAKIPEGLLTG